AGAGRLRDAERAYRAAARDAALGPLAIYRRARILVRLGDPGAREALGGFAQSYPGDSAAPTALYVLGDMYADRGDWAGAAQWFAELVARYPADVRASLARFRLAAVSTPSCSPASTPRPRSKCGPCWAERRSRTSTRCSP